MARYSRNDQAGVDLPKARLDRTSLSEALQVLGCILPYRGRFTSAVLASLAGSLLSLAFPYMAGAIVDHAAAARGVPAGMTHANREALLLLGILALQAVLSFYHALSFASVAQRSLVDLRSQVYGRLITLPMTFFSQRRVGELSSRLSSDLIQIEDTLIAVVPQMLRHATLLIGGVLLIASTSLQLTAIMLASLPVLVAAAVVFGRRTRRIAREAQDRLADTATIVEETLQGILNVKAFSNEGHEVQRYRAGLEHFLQTALRGARVRAAFIAFVIFSLFGSVVLVLWSGARLMQQGQISFGQLTRFILYTTFVAGAMGQVAELYSQIQKTVGATQRVREILGEPGEMDPPFPTGATVPPLPRLQGRVEACDLHFAYPTRPESEVLTGIGFTVQPGQRIALVGPSGSGKSTLISLILRLYDPTSGTLRIDGRNAADYPLAALRNQMALVPQEVLLFGGSIAENIAYGRPGASREEVMAAARAANADEFVRGFPEGYDTIVGERGTRLSGGQRQRIAIARAILKDPAILLLDEATSALDSESEGLVQAALETLMTGRTSFIIAHRLATVRTADQIIVISGGRVVETGTHEQLQAKPDGLYRRLAAMQFREGACGLVGKDVVGNVAGA